MEKFGGNRIGPTLPPSNDSRSSSSSRLFTGFCDSRFQCVMNLEAFQAKTKCLPVSRRQPRTLRRRRAIEDTIELSGFELARIIAKLVLERHAFRIERPPPGLVVPARRADQNASHLKGFAQLKGGLRVQSFLRSRPAHRSRVRVTGRNGLPIRSLSIRTPVPNPLATSLAQP